MPTTTDADHLDVVTDLCVDVLSATIHGDWSARPPDLEMTVAELVAHIAQTGYWYAIDLAARGPDLGAVEPVVDATAAPEMLVATLRTGFRLLADVVRTAPPAARGFHPFGQADASGFAAMACDELLVHTHDVAAALDRPFRPDDDLVQPVLQRLFPWAPQDPDDVWEELLWANGRLASAGRPRQHRWTWHCAPLEEWDGGHSTVL